MKARIKRLNKNVELPKYQTAESAAFDIASSVDIAIAPGEIVKIPTGLVIEAPEGHFLAIVARGSTAIKTGLKLANAMGVVDRDYAGPNDEVFLSVHNFTNKETVIFKGDRIAQGMFLKVDQVEWEEMSEIRAESRGGYGSTGGYGGE
jgi:dUTP pyrophosphatase